VEELDVVVDRSAAYSWVSRSRLQSLGVTAVRRIAILGVTVDPGKKLVPTVGLALVSGEDF